MNISELCIRRPIMVVLLSISLILVGVLAYRSIPVAALPSYNTPVINVNANLSGASPETMASRSPCRLKNSSPPLPAST